MNTTARRARPGELLAAVTFVLTLACAAGHAARAAEPAHAQGAAGFRPSPVAWAPCPENSKLECGVLQLPVSYAQPHGPRFGMGVVRAPATDANRRIGVLMMNPGGPGISGVSFLQDGISFGVPIIGRLRERFDIVSFDPRGTQRSHPVRCPLNLPPPPAGADDAALAAYLDDLGRRYASACAQQSGPFVFTLSQNNIARDMDMLRQSLGEPTVSYIGMSFGTQLGAVYASMFPHRLRAVALDAGVAPEVGGAGLLDFSLEQRASIAFVFNRLDLLCRADPLCPLHTSGVQSAYDTLAARLKAAPVHVAGVRLSNAELDLAVLEALYAENRWPAITTALQAAMAGDYAPLAQLYRSATTNAVDLQAFTPTICSTYAARLPAEQVLPIDATASAAHPRLQTDNAPPTVATDRLGIALGLALCSAWPAAEETVIRDLRSRLKHPILMIAGDFDLAAPPAWSRALAEALGFPRSVVRYRGGGHRVVTSVNPCFDDMIVSYLVDLQSPPEGTTCPARPIAFGAQ